MMGLTEQAKSVARRMKQSRWQIVGLVLVLLTLTGILLSGCKDEDRGAKQRSRDFDAGLRDGRETNLPPYGLYRTDPEAGNRLVPVTLGTQPFADNLGRCAGINNYWCIKTPGSASWKGQTGADSSGHAIFSDPVYSARAFARLMRIYRFRHGLLTLRQVAQRYAPPGDCVGSLSFCPVSDEIRVGADRPQRQVGDQLITYSLNLPGADFERRPLANCDRPLLYCPRGINQTEAYAKALATVVGLASIDDEIALFDAKGRLNFVRAQALFQAVSRFELGAEFAVDPTLIRRGMLMEAQDYLRENHRLY